MDNSIETILNKVQISESFINDLEKISCDDFIDAPKEVVKILEKNNMKNYHCDDDYFSDGFDGYLGLDKQSDDLFYYELIYRFSGSLRRILRIYFDSIGETDDCIVTKIVVYNSGNYTVDALTRIEYPEQYSRLDCDSELYKELKNKLIGFSLSQNVRKDLEKIFDSNSFNIFLVEGNENIYYSLDVIDAKTYYIENSVGIVMENDVIKDLVYHDLYDSKELKKLFGG